MLKLDFSLWAEVYKAKSLVINYLNCTCNNECTYNGHAIYL